MYEGAERLKQKYVGFTLIELLIVVAISMRFRGVAFQVLSHFAERSY